MVVSVVFLLFNKSIKLLLQDAHRPWISYKQVKFFFFLQWAEQITLLVLVVLSECIEPFTCLKWILHVTLGHLYKARENNI